MTRDEIKIRYMSMSWWPIFPSHSQKSPTNVPHVSSSMPHLIFGLNGGNDLNQIESDVRSGWGGGEGVARC